MSGLKLVVFDVDGTLIDSQADIVHAMTAAFETCNLPAPTRALILGQVGLSLPQVMARLAPDAPGRQPALVAAYKDAFATARRQQGAEPKASFYPGMRALLDELRARDDILLAVATGKSRRGLHALIDAHGLEGMFVSLQCADDHPSKPHPSMLMTCLSEVGVAASDAVMIGDTSYDMDMARAAGLCGIAVPWGYHRPEQLTAARHMLTRPDALPDLLAQIWET